MLIVWSNSGLAGRPVASRLQRHSWFISHHKISENQEMLQNFLLVNLL
jgi:hypothetical protein